jgi:hypothetical protein
MTVENIELYPTGDIHLLLEWPGAGATYQLRVRDYVETNVDLSGLTARTTYTGHNTTIAGISPTGLITPRTVGETLCRIRHTDTGPAPANQVFNDALIADMDGFQAIVNTRQALQLAREFRFNIS